MIVEQRLNTRVRVLAPRRKWSRIVNKYVFWSAAVALLVILGSVFVIVPDSWPGVILSYLLILYYIRLLNSYTITSEGIRTLPRNIIVYGYFAIALFLTYLYVATSYSINSGIVVWIFFILPIGATSYWGKTEYAIAGTVFSAIFLLAMTTIGSLKEGVRLFSSISTLAALLSPSAMLGIIGLTIAFVTKPLKKARAEGYILRNVLIKLSGFKTPQHLADDIARLIHDKLGYPIVHILFWDDEQQQLRIDGVAGVNKQATVDFPVKKGEGITGKVFADGVTINDPDVRRAESHYIEPPNECYQGIKSELATPIGSRSSPIGVLDLESRTKAEFTKDDEFAVESIAAAIGVAYQHENSTATLDLGWLNLLGDLRHVEELADIRRVFEYTAEKAMDRLFDTKPDFLLLYQLVPETGGYPVVPPLYYPSDALEFPEKLKYPPWEWKPDNVLFRLINRWEFHPSLDSKNDDLLRGGKSDFVERERVSSTVFLPLGEPSAKIGALFFDYHNHTKLSENDIKLMRQMALVLSLRMKEIRDRKQVERSSKRVPSQMHEVLGKHLPALQGKLANAISELQTNNVTNHKRLLNMILEAQQYAQTEFRENAQMAAKGLLWDLSQSARDILSKTASSIEYSSPIHLRCDVDVAPEANEFLQMYQSFKETLCCFAAEAMINSVKHGHATIVRSTISMGDNSIIISVKDNGRGFDTAPFERGARMGGPQGIYEWKRIVCEDFGAMQCKIDSSTANGTTVSAIVPILTRSS